MFGIFFVNRLSQSNTALSATVLLMAVLIALPGCRILSPNTSAPSPAPLPPLTAGVQAPQVSLPPPVQEMPEQFSVFRPIMPGEFLPPIPERTIPAQEPRQEPVELPGTEPKPDNAVQEIAAPTTAAQKTVAQTTIDELNQRIRELETQLEETARTPPPVTLEELFEVATPEVKVTKPLPIINKQDVRVSADDSQNVRIEIMDRVLFVPNAWQLSAEGEETLRAIAAEMRAYNPHALIDIEGHTDSLMSDPNNPTQKHEIATAKTRAAMDFFVNALRWDAAQISTSSFGRSRPLADNGTPEGRARNNRIEIVVRSESESEEIMP